MDREKDMRDWKHILENNPDTFFELMKQHKIVKPEPTKINDPRMGDIRRILATHMDDKTRSKYREALGKQGFEWSPGDKSFMKEHYRMKMNSRERDGELERLLQKINGTSVPKKGKNKEKEKHKMESMKARSEALTELGARTTDIRHAIRYEHPESVEHFLLKASEEEKVEIWKELIQFSPDRIIDYMINRGHFTKEVQNALRDTNDKDFIEDVVPSGNVALLKMLLKSGIITKELMNSRNSFGDTILHQAAMLETKEKAAGMTTVLLNTGMLTQETINARDDLRVTALWRAAKKGYDEMVKLLLPFSSKDAMKSAMNVANEFNRQKIVRMIRYFIEKNTIKDQNEKYT